MPSFKELKTRINSVTNTRKITKAMKLVAGAKFNRAQTNILNARPYAQTLLSVISDLSTALHDDPPELMAKRPQETIHLLVITSDKGLCGSFNTNIIKKAEQFLKSKEDSDLKIQLSVIGKKAISYFEKRGYEIKRKYQDVLTEPSFSSAKVIAEDVVNDYLDHSHDAFFISYNEFKSVIQQKPTIEQLLPIEPIPELKGQVINPNYLFEPNQAHLLKQILPRYFTSQIYRAILESVASEHGARMTAMDNATNNATDLIGALQLQYNKLRQASITTEILEIVGGAEALSQNS